MPHFFANDLAELLLAFLIEAIVILFPGFGLAWALNLFQVRSISANDRWLLAPAIGLSLLPILLFVPFRLISASAMWSVAALLVLLGMVTCWRDGKLPKLVSVPTSLRVSILTWAALCLGLMLDVSVGDRLYPSTVIVDTSFRSQVISSLVNATHLPPKSLFFFPGHDETLRYHYIYFLAPALAVKVSHGLVSSAMALVALTLWTGLGFFGVVAAVIRFFWNFPVPQRALKIALALLAVSGLDVLFAGADMARRGLSGHFIFTGPDIGLWNGWGSVFGWLSTAIWSPHHLAGIMAGSIGCLLLWHSRELSGWTRWAHSIAAGICFATLVGSSVYISGIYAVFLFLVAIELTLNAPRFLAPVVFSGAVAVALITRFLLDARPLGSSAAPSFFNFQIRAFLPVTLLYSTLDIKSSLLWNLSYLAVLPLTFFFQFGIFFLGGIWWLHTRRSHPPEAVFRDHMIIGLGAISLLLPSLAWSGTEVSNDLGFRGVLPAQLLLLFCTTALIDHLSQNPLERKNRLGTLTAILLILGLGTTLLEVVVMRGGVGRTAKNTILIGEMFRPDTSAERLFQLREAYTWARKNTRRDAVLQENPITWQDPALGQYAERRTVVYGSYPSYMVGQDHSGFLEAAGQVKKLFAAESNEDDVASTCRRFKIDYVVVQSGDPVWAKADSYVWNTHAIFERPLVRVVQCPKSVPGSPAAGGRTSVITE